MSAVQITRAGSVKLDRDNGKAMLVASACDTDASEVLFDVAINYTFPTDCDILEAAGLVPKCKCISGLQLDAHILSRQTFSLGGFFGCNGYSNACIGSIGSTTNVIENNQRIIYGGLCPATWPTPSGDCLFPDPCASDNGTFGRCREDPPASGLFPHRWSCSTDVNLPADGEDVLNFTTTGAGEPNVEWCRPTASRDLQATYSFFIDTNPGAYGIGAFFWSWSGTISLGTGPYSGNSFVISRIFDPSVPADYPSGSTTPTDLDYWIALGQPTTMTFTLQFL